MLPPGARAQGREGHTGSECACGEGQRRPERKRVAYNGERERARVWRLGGERVSEAASP